MSDPRRCEFVIERKQRRCRMLTKLGNKFCGEHLVHDPKNTSRVSCPNDPTHTVEQKELKEHLRRCNARLSDEPWIRKDLNRLKRPAESGDCSLDEFQRPSDEQVNSIVKIIDDVYDQIKDDFAQLPDLSFYDRNLKTSDDRNAKKNGHLIQLGSIIDHLEAHNLLHDSADSCLIDLGSGKAQLIYWVAKRAPKCNFLLIDRMGARNKYDRRAINEDPSLSIQRLRCSIEHLDLKNVPLITKCKSRVAVCKHFCGSATDAGIRCIENGIRGGVECIGFALAPCCHHKCEYEEFVGRQFLDSINIKTAEDFSALRHVSTWATCQFRELDSNTPVGRLNTQKLEWGRRAKRLIETARARHLSTLGYRVRIYQYVDYDVSPENLLIVGEQISRKNELT